VNEPPPKDYTSAMVKVDYDENSWRETLTNAFRQVSEGLKGRHLNQKILADMVNGFYRIATHASIQAKQVQWAVEQEYRRVVLLRDPKQLLKRILASGKESRYISTLVREEGKLIALDEITIGPNQDPADARRKLERLLSDCGYEPGMPEYPEITVSAALPLAK
jgi:hypothetical protein